MPSGPITRTRTSGAKFNFDEKRYREHLRIEGMRSTPVSLLCRESKPDAPDAQSTPNRPHPDPSEASGD